MGWGSAGLGEQLGTGFEEVRSRLHEAGQGWAVAGRGGTGWGWAGWVGAGLRWVSAEIGQVDGTVGPGQGHVR